MTPAEVDKVRDIFVKTGGLKETHKLMDRLLHDGQKALDKASPPLKPKYKEFLLELAEFLVKRDF
jgi:geranylgeranyl pyrophosphate synthase